MVVDQRVPDEPRRLPLRENPPTEAEPERTDDARPRKPAAERPLPAGKCQGQPDGGWRPDDAERILRERRHAERREARGDTPAPFLGETGEDEREAPRERRYEECFGTDVAREREEPRARQERRPRDEAAARAEELGAQPGRRRYSGEGAERGNRARRRLARAGEGEGSTQEHVEERRLVHVADAVQCQRAGMARAEELARDLGVHALARVVEGHPPEPHEDERRRGEDRERRRGERGTYPGQVRGTRNTPAATRTSTRASIKATSRSPRAPRARPSGPGSRAARPCLSRGCVRA